MRRQHQRGVRRAPSQLWVGAQSPPWSNGGCSQFIIVNVNIMSLRGEYSSLMWGILQKGVPQCHSTALTSVVTSLLAGRHLGLWSLIGRIQPPDTQSANVSRASPDSCRAITMKLNRSGWASPCPPKLPQHLPSWRFYQNLISSSMLMLNSNELVLLPCGDGRGVFW